MTERDSAHHCPECGAPLVKGAAECWLCAASRSPSGGAPATCSPPRRVPWTFGLNSLFLCVTLAAFVMAVAKLSPGVALAMTLLFLHAGIRTASVARRRMARTARPLAIREKIGEFGLSIILVIPRFVGTTAIVAGCGMALMTLVPRAWAEQGVKALIIALMVSVITMYLPAFFVNVTQKYAGRKD